MNSIYNTQLTQQGHLELTLPLERCQWPGAGMPPADPQPVQDNHKYIYTLIIMPHIQCTVIHTKAYLFVTQLLYQINMHLLEVHEAFLPCTCDILCFCLAAKLWDLVQPHSPLAQTHWAIVKRHGNQTFLLMSRPSNLRSGRKHRDSFSCGGLLNLYL